jgi:hypothetical protein
MIFPNILEKNKNRKGLPNKAIDVFDDFIGETKSIQVTHI